MSVAEALARRWNHQREDRHDADRRQEDAAERHEAAVRGVRFPLSPARRAGRGRRRERGPHHEIEKPSVSAGADRADGEIARLLRDDPREHWYRGEDPQQHVFALDAVAGPFCRRQWSLSTRKTT